MRPDRISADSGQGRGPCGHGGYREHALHGTSRIPSGSAGAAGFTLMRVARSRGAQLRRDWRALFLGSDVGDALDLDAGADDEAGGDGGAGGQVGLKVFAVDGVEFGEVFDVGEEDGAFGDLVEG
jgi:hypothetical protein